MSAAMTDLLQDPSVGAVVRNAPDITAHKEAQDSLEWDSKVNAALAELYQPLVSPTASVPEISRTILDRARQSK